MSTPEGTAGPADGGAGQRWEGPTVPAAPAPPPRPPGEAVITATGLVRRFGDLTVVDGLDLEVTRGEIIGLIGPSGSGKTTTVRMFTGVLAPSGGDVRVLGVAPTTFSRRDRDRIGYMPQLSVLYPNLSLLRNLSFAASLYGMPWRRRRRRLLDALDFVELAEHRKTMLRRASGGMQRRLALAATLVHDPELIFLDEPTAGIDPLLRRKFWDRFEALRDSGCTLVITTQYVGEAAYCDRVGVLAEGRLLALDTPDGLRRRALGGHVIIARAGAYIDGAHLEPLAALPFVHGVSRGEGTSVRVLVDEPAEAMPSLTRWFEDQGVPLDAIEEHVPTFDDVFVTIVERQETNAA